MMKSYNIISELLRSLDNDIHPNIDMLIIKPALYTYVSNDKLQDAKKIGIKAGEDGLIHAYFSRIPETVNDYSEYLKTHTPLKIMISKLKAVKDQKITIKPINMPEIQKNLTEDDIKKIGKKNKFFFKFFTDGRKLSELPHAAINAEKGFLPAFVYKVITPKIQTIE